MVWTCYFSFYLSLALPLLQTWTSDKSSSAWLRSLWCYRLPIHFSRACASVNAIQQSESTVTPQQTQQSKPSVDFVRLSLIASHLSCPLPLLSPLARSCYPALSNYHHRRGELHQQLTKWRLQPLSNVHQTIRSSTSYTYQVVSNDPTDKMVDSCMTQKW